MTIDEYSIEARAAELDAAFNPVAYDRFNRHLD